MTALNELYGLNEVAWRTVITDVILINEPSDEIPAIWRATIVPSDINQPGAENSEKAIGYLLKDNIGHTYRTVAFDGDTVDVSDDFMVDQCPQSGRNAVYYKPTDRLFLARIFYNYLSDIAVEYSNQLENSILWHTRESIPFVNVDTLSSDRPSIPNKAELLLGETFQTLYSNRFVDDCDMTLILSNEDGTEWVASTQPIRNIVDGKLISAYFDLQMGVISGRILLSR